MRPLPLLTRPWRLDFEAFVSLASAKLELSPKVTLPQPPAISLPNEIEKVLRFYRDENKFEANRLSGKPRTHGPTTAYYVEDAILGGGSVFARGSALPIGSSRDRIWISGQRQFFDEALLVTSACAELYFGDWLLEGLGLELLAVDMEWEPIRFYRKPWLHENGYRSMTQLDSRTVKYANVGKLWLVDDRGINESRRRRFIELRRRVRQGSSDFVEAAPRRVFLTRGKLGSARDLTNLDDVVRALESSGFTVVEPESETPQSLAKKLVNAQIVVAPEGSAHVHALLAIPSSSGLINIQPPMRFTAPAKDMADVAGMRYGYIVAEPDGKSFRIAPDRLIKLIELMERELAR